MADKNDHEPPLPSPREISTETPFPESQDLARRIKASDELLWQLAEGRKFPEAPHLIRGKKRFAEKRVPGIARRDFMSCCAGLPEAYPAITSPVPADCELHFLADRETMNWQPVLFQRLRGIMVPVIRPGVARTHLSMLFVRVILGWSASYAEFHQGELPARFMLGAQVYVKTIPFMEAIGSPSYPFMMSFACHDHVLLPMPAQRIS